MNSYTAARINRRSLLKGGAGGLAALALLNVPPFGGGTPTASASTSGMPGPLAWVWRFDADGSPEEIRSVLAAYGVGILYKVADGVNWMGRHDRRSPMQIHSAADIRPIAEFFEAGGVPFHAWTVVNGRDPITEARIASEALNNGARTLTFDLELPEGTNYWHGTPQDALILGQELRSLQPTAYLSVAPDSRPWQLRSLPMAEFASFCDDIQPQTYWDTFNTPSNLRLLGQHGHTAGPEGVTPELILDATMSALQQHGRPVRPIGQGASSGPAWERFAAHAAAHGMPGISVWRYGTATSGVWPVLQQSTPAAAVSAPEPEPEPEPAPPEPQPEPEPAAAASPEPEPAPEPQPLAAEPAAASRAATTEEVTALQVPDAGSEPARSRAVRSRRRFGLGF